MDSLKEYQMVVSHGPNVLCALLRTRLAVDVSLFDFYHALCSKGCAFCGEFSGFISLLTWNRCCFKCLQGAPEIQLQTLAAVRKQFHLSKAELGRLRLCKPLPGVYSMNESVHKSHIHSSFCSSSDVDFRTAATSRNAGTAGELGTESQIQLHGVLRASLL